jgi:calcium-binding protein CML
MVKVYDENRDGKIDFYEFVKLIEKSFSWSRLE